MLSSNYLDTRKLVGAMSSDEWFEDDECANILSLSDFEQGVQLRVAGESGRSHVGRASGDFFTCCGNVY